MRLALVFTLVLASGAARAQAVALVTDLVGDSKPAILSEVSRDAELKLAKSAKLTVLYYASGHEFSFEGPAAIRFGPDQPMVLEGAPARRRALTAKGVTVRPGEVAPATFVMRGPKTTPPAADAPLSERVAYAVWLEQSGMKQDAAPLWRALAAERPGSARLRELATGK
jgi:hypothetical protein